MRTYRELFRTPEFTPLFCASTAQVAAQTVAGLALGTLVHRATGSPLLSALAMSGPALAQVAGAATLLSAADRLPPRAAMTGLSLLFGLGTAAQAIPGLPVAAVFVLLAALGVLASPGGGVRQGLLHEIVATDGYLLGRSLLNLSVGATQTGAFALGGVLVATLSPRGTLLAAAALHGVAAAVARWGLTRRPPRATGRPSIAATWRDNARLWSSRPRRYVFLALWVPNGLIVGCESLFVAYAPEDAGPLLASAAAGMLTGDLLAGRFLPGRWRRVLAVPLLLLLAAPYALFVLRPPLPVLVAATALSALGYAASLLLLERLMDLTPDGLAGHALGLHTSGMLALQGVGAVLAGTAAELTSPSMAMAVMAAVSVAVTLTLARGLPRGDRGRPTAPGPGTGRGTRWRVRR
ncbi:MFS transporter [Streptomyces sp. NPDC057116]|uniref:MFS transporter n=1 Tax=Streptomyces sp. NPDC057116 TaxID=3346023 RepID=UPI003627B678